MTHLITIAAEWAAAERDAALFQRLKDASACAAQLTKELAAAGIGHNIAGTSGKNTAVQAGMATEL
jgi:hypothetical protein